jgi:peptidoglycan/LPS O-acetylase OafA/YrhL
VAPQALWPNFTAGVHVTDQSPFSLGVLGLGSVALVIGAATLPTLSRPLSWRPIQYLGRLSFSIYLVHYTIILLFIGMLDRPTTLMHALLFFSVTAGITVLLSDLSYRFIERPSIGLGRLVSGWMSARMTRAR